MVAEMLGMGITIQLRNMFSAPAAAVVASSRTITEAITRDQEKTMNGWKLMAAGGSMMFLGTGMLAFLGSISKLALKSSSDLEIFRLQMRLLAHDATVGDTLFNQLKLFSTTTPFTIPQVMAGARSLLSFGFGAERVLGQLKMAGDWASMMNMPIEEAAMILGKVRSGALSYAMRSLQRAGIGYADIAAAGGPIDPKTMRTQRGADPEKFLDAVNKVINQKFSGSMGLIMQTVPGMLTNMKDQMILMGSTIGDAIKPQIKEILHSILAIFNPNLILPFARAVGDGLANVVRFATVILRPIGQMIMWYIELAKAHPMIAQTTIALIALAGVILTVSGAALIMLGIWNIISTLLASEATAAFFAGLSGALVPIGLLIGAGVLLYNMFQHNFLGITDVAMWFYERFKLIAVGVIDLFSSLSSGVGYLSLDTANALERYGLLGVVEQLFMLGYRLISFVEGIGDAFVGAIDVLSFFGSVIGWVLSPVWGLAAAGLELARGLGFINLVGTTSSNMFRVMGSVVGALLVGFAAYRAAAILAAGAQFAWTLVTGGYNVIMGTYITLMYVWTNATRIATAAQWLWNIAMDSNPVGAVIMGVAALVTLVVVFITHARQISAWFSSLGPMGRLMFTAFFPLVTAAIQIYRHWDMLKSIFVEAAQLVRNVFGAVLEWIGGKIQWLWDKVTSIVAWVRSIPAVSKVLGNAQQDIHTQAGDIRMDADKAQQLTARAIITSGALQERVLTAVHDELLKLNAHFATPQPATPVVVAVDGRVLAHTVNKHNENKKAGGR